MLSSDLQQKINHGYTFQIGQYVSEGFRIFSQEAGLFVGFTLLYFVIAMACAFIPIANIIVAPCLIVGYFLVAQKVRNRQFTQLGDFFKSFDFWGQIALYQLSIVAIVLCAILPIFLMIGFAQITHVFDNSFEEVREITSSGLGLLGICYFFIVVFGSIYLGVALLFTTQLIAFHKMHFWEALNLSRQIISANWFAVFFFLVLLGLINIMGFIPCGLGLLVTIPATYTAIYAAFEDIVGTDKPIFDNELDVI